MKVKIIDVPYIGAKKLYMCPNCKKGHQVEYGIKKCDVCGIDLDWSEIDPSEDKK